MTKEEKRAYINTLSAMIDGIESHARDRSKQVEREGGLVIDDRELNRIWTVRARLASARSEVGLIITKGE